MPQKVIDNVAVLTTPQSMMQAIDDNFDELYSGAGTAVSDQIYDETAWDGVSQVAASKNTIRDKVVMMDATIALNTAKISFDSTSSDKLNGIEENAEVNNITDEYVAVLTESGNTTLHYHSTDRDRANHTGTQVASTISDFSSAVAANSIASIIEDTTPELGGELDAGAHSIGFTQQATTGDGTTTINWTLGNKFKFTFGTHNETFTFTSPSNPCNLLLMLLQDSTGSRTVTWPATVKWAGGVAPNLTTTANAIDIVSMYWSGDAYYGQCSYNFS